MTLAKAKLQWEAKGNKDNLECQFNPSELAITKKATWKTASTSGEDTLPSRNAPFLEFKGGDSATYSLALFFDANSSNRCDDVRFYTDQVIKLAMRGAGQASSDNVNADPPIVTFVWGKIILFKAVVTNVVIKFTLFAGDGTPIRATANVDFTQQDQSDDLTPKQNPSSRSDPRKTYIVHAAQRLDQIAYEEYADSRYWRLLAEANNLDNPFQLNDGQLLVIPLID